MKKLRVTVDGKIYDVLVEMLDEQSSPARAETPVALSTPVAPPAGSAPVTSVAPAPAPAATPPPAAGSGSVVSPLTGKIVSIDVKVGDVVAEGAQLVTLEAMKMNTFVYASRAGKVSGVHAAPGEAIEEGAPLLTLA